MRIIEAILQVDGKKHPLELYKSTYLDSCFVTTEYIQELNQKRFKMMLHPKEHFIIERLYLVVETEYGNDPIFCNGIQSWTESRQFNPTEKIPDLHWLAKNIIKPYGDYTFLDPKESDLHSWNYTYIREKDDSIQFAGSLDEKSAYTVFWHQPKSRKMLIECDAKNLRLEHSFPAFDLWFDKGTEADVFQRFFAEQGLEKKQEKTTTGWTSWYYHYTKISEEIILQNLNAFAERKLDIDYFQIDDGYQKSVGDWLEIKSNFTNGMASIARKAHQANYKAGLWLAPFIVEKKSTIFQQKKDWLLKHPNGKYVVAGYNPMWSGSFYALDIYHPGVREYLTGVFHTVLQKWNFDLVKLDFLYAPAIIGRENKTRGQVMFDAVEFLRGICGTKKILGCGVPLAPAFGQFDYCRIGADVHTKWEHGFLKFIRNRERVSTIVSLRSTLSRWHLNGYAFFNDPDVFMLRDAKNKHTDDEKETLFIVNALLGGLVFTSDDLSEYPIDRIERMRSWLTNPDFEIRSVVDRNGVYTIGFKQGDTHYNAFVNLTDKAVNVKGVHLRKHQTVIQ